MPSLRSVLSAVTLTAAAAALPLAAASRTGHGAADGNGYPFVSLADVECFPEEFSLCAVEVADWREPYLPSNVDPLEWKNGRLHSGQVGGFDCDVVPSEMIDASRQAHVIMEELHQLVMDFEAKAAADLKKAQMNLISCNVDFTEFMSRMPEWASNNGMSETLAQAAFSEEAELALKSIAPMRFAEMSEANKLMYMASMLEEEFGYDKSDPVIENMVAAQLRIQTEENQAAGKCIKTYISGGGSWRNAKGKAKPIECPNDIPYASIYQDFVRQNNRNPEPSMSMMINVDKSDFEEDPDDPNARFVTKRFTEPFPQTDDLVEGDWYDLASRLEDARDTLRSCEDVHKDQLVDLLDFLCVTNGGSFGTPGVMQKLEEAREVLYTSTVTAAFEEYKSNCCTEQSVMADWWGHTASKKVNNPQDCVLSNACELNDGGEKLSHAESPRPLGFLQIEQDISGFEDSNIGLNSVLIDGMADLQCTDRYDLDYFKFGDPLTTDYNPFAGGHRYYRISTGKEAQERMDIMGMKEGMACPAKPYAYTGTTSEMGGMAFVEGGYPTLPAGMTFDIDYI